MSRNKIRGATSARLATGVVLGAALALAWAAPGGALAAGAGETVHKIGPTTALTLTEWNWDTVGNSPDSNAVLSAVIKGFEAKYPHIKVVNTSMSLSEQTDKLPLDLRTASSSPIVTQVNEGFGSMGRLVTDHELVPLTHYDALYHWSPRVGRLPLEVNSFTPDGVSFGTGNIYGVPWTGVVVGVFYNKDILASVGAKPPTSWASFTRDLALVHKAGKVALAFSGGQPTEFQPEHDFQFLLEEFVPAKQLDAFIFHKGPHPSIDVPGAITAAQTYVSWARDGYFNAGYQGTSDTQALNLFDSGKAAFFVEGNWHIGSVYQALGAKAGFWVPPEATGSVGEPWSIPTHSANPDAAAAWIDWVVSPEVQEMQLKAGNIPVIALSAKQLASVPEIEQVAAARWKKLVSTHQLVTFIDWAAPPLLNSFQADIGELLAGRTSPQAMMHSLQGEYASWAADHYKK